MEDKNLTEPPEFSEGSAQMTTIFFPEWGITASIMPSPLFSDTTYLSSKEPIRTILPIILDR